MSKRTVTKVLHSCKECGINSADIEVTVYEYPEGDFCSIECHFMFDHNANLD